MQNKINIHRKTQLLIICIVLIIATLVVYWQVKNFDFVNFDDNFYITLNTNIHKGLTKENVCWAFTTKYFGLWNPLVWLSFMLDYELFSLNAGGYHVTNLILHILSTLLLFWLFNRMTKEIWKSAFVAAFFALHPLHVESVAWISERKDVLSAFFWMLTLCLYVYYTEKPAVKRYLLVLCSFVLALMSKPMVITLPLIMILLDYWPLRRLESHKGKDNLVSWQLKEKLPFFALSLFLVIINFYPSASYISPFIGKDIPLISRLANAPISVIMYLEKTFLPVDMAIFYPFTIQIPIWQFSGAIFLILIISIAVVLMARRMPYLFVGWLWYVITLLPVIKLLQVGNDAMADRYHYLTSIGLALMLAWGIPSLIKNATTRKIFLFPAVIAALAISIFLSWQQCGHWRDSISLFSHAVEVTEDNYLAHTNIANALAEKKNFNKAIYHYNKAIQIDPYCPIYYEGRGKAYAGLGNYRSAVNDFNEAIRLKPDYADAYNNRAFLFMLQGNKNLGCSDAKRACALGNCKLLEKAKDSNKCR